MIPLGGYVRIKGEALGEGDDQQGSLSAATLLQRFAIIAAGPIANVILAFVILFMVNFSYGVYTQGQYNEVGISSVAEDSPASRVGLQAGDIITKLDGVPINEFGDIIRVMQGADGTAIPLSYTRGDSSYRDQILPTLVTENRYILGITAPKIQRIQQGALETFSVALQQLVWFGTQILQGLAGLFVGAVDFAEFGGPIKIAQYSGEVLVSGTEQFLLFAAMLSVNLALINLFPIPGLDGGHLLWLIVEGVIRRPPPLKLIHLTNNLGILFVLGLIVLITVKDIYQLFI